MPTVEALEMVENPNVPVIYADEVTKVQVVGHRARITYCEVRELDGRDVYWPVCEMIRPVETVASNKLVMMVTEAMKRAASAISALYVSH